MEIIAIETLTNAEWEVDRALGTGNKTLHRFPENSARVGSSHQSESSNSIRDKRVYIGCMRAKPTPRSSRQAGVETTQGSARGEMLRG